MFSENKKRSIAKSMDMSIEELDSFVKRYRGYLSAKVENVTISKNVILNGLWLVAAVKKDSLIERQQKREAINFGSMRNEYIRKYGVKILELRDDENYGAQRISKYLKVTHNVNISKATIERFLKLNEVRCHG